MRQTGLLHYVLPELEVCINVDQPGGYHRYPVFEHILYTIDACKPELRLRLAALFHDITKPQAKRIVDDGATFYGHETTGAKVAQKVLKRLRYSNDMVDDVATLVERHMFTTDVTDKGLRRLVRRVGVPLIFDLLDLRRADVIAQGMGGKTDDVDRFEAEIKVELEKKPPFSVSDLAIDGNDIMRLFSLSPGPMIGEILNFLLEQALDNPEINTPDHLTALAQEFYEQKLKK
jgi:putative nucleotidyltransferase with HDIG domain